MTSSHFVLPILQTPRTRIHSQKKMNKNKSVKSEKAQVVKVKAKPILIKIEKPGQSQSRKPPTIPSPDIVQMAQNRQAHSPSKTTRKPSSISQSISSEKAARSLQSRKYNQLVSNNQNEISNNKIHNRQIAALCSFSIQARAHHQPRHQISAKYSGYQPKPNHAFGEHNPRKPKQNPC